MERVIAIKKLERMRPERLRLVYGLTLIKAAGARTSAAEARLFALRRLMRREFRNIFPT